MCIINVIDNVSEHIIPVMGICMVACELDNFPFVLTTLENCILNLIYRWMDGYFYIFHYVTASYTWIFISKFCFHLIICIIKSPYMHIHTKCGKCYGKASVFSTMFVGGMVNSLEFSKIHSYFE